MSIEKKLFLNPETLSEEDLALFRRKSQFTSLNTFVPSIVMGGAYYLVAKKFCGF